MAYDRTLLPDPLDYYAGQGLQLVGIGKWRTTGCPFHGSSDSLRINIQTGGFICMACCGARGGDVLAFEMALSGRGFVECAKALAAWTHDGQQEHRRKPSPFSARDAIEVAADEILLVAVALTNFHCGVELTEADLERLRLASARLTTIRDWISA
jgi:hypothetical protein